MSAGRSTRLAALLFALACTTVAAQQDDTVPPDAVVPPPEAFTACDPGDRPQVCTQEYAPVCAAIDTGIRCVTTPCDSTEWRTFPNACAACAEGGVIGWRETACPGG